ESVMVFPQGIFSAEAMCALRHSDLLAAVNTELIDFRSKAGVSGWELLKPAITSYSGFPLFLRRSPKESTANFALDLVLGKPVLAVTHHEFFAEGLPPFIDFVGRMNLLDSQLVWTNV